MPDSFLTIFAIIFILDSRCARIVTRRGKFFTRSHYDFERLYPKFRTFAALKAALDPHGVFANPFLNSLFGDSGAQKQLKSAL